MLSNYTYIYIYNRAFFGAKKSFIRNSLIFLWVTFYASKKCEKKLQKCLENKNKALPLHPQSETNTLLNAAKKKVLKNILKKSFQKIWWFQKYDLSLHPLSPLKRRRAEKVLRKFFLKKVHQKFGGSKNLPYLCTTFPLQKMKFESELKMVLWFTGFIIERKV